MKAAKTLALFSSLRGTLHHLLLFAGRGPAAEASGGELLAGYEGTIEPHLIVVREPTRMASPGVRRYPHRSPMTVSYAFVRQPDTFAKGGPPWPSR